MASSPAITKDMLSNPDTPRTRAVSVEEFTKLAVDGRTRLEAMRADPADPAGLDRNFDALGNQAFDATRAKWGGVTINAVGRRRPQAGDVAPPRATGQRYHQHARGRRQTSWSTSIRQETLVYLESIAFNQTFSEDDRGSTSTINVDLFSVSRSKVILERRHRRACCLGAGACHVPRFLHLVLDTRRLTRLRL